MFKASWHEKQILIVLVWSVLIFIGYNVLTVEAEHIEIDEEGAKALHEEAEDKKNELEYFWGNLEKDEVDVLCDASEDYEKFKKGCDAAYDSVDTPKEEEEKVEDWRNEVEVEIPPAILEEGYEHKIASPRIIHENEEDREKQQEENAKYEEEAVEPQDDGSVVEEEENDEPEEEEEESDENEEEEEEPEEDSESESEE